ncbi:MAG: hypothetical protein KKA76_07570 [Proteobacteria bacterium]|nr:hypothetical protein [Pseudomonadota bacterium]
MFPSILLTGLWHSTSPERYDGIVETGAILPEPDLPETERWGSKMGKEHYPLVRALGGVSLFDFNDFEPEKYSKKFISSSWTHFVPGRSSWPQTIWIKIDRSSIIENLITGNELLKIWNDSMYGHNLMPIIECAHIGKLPTKKFQEIFCYDSKSDKFIGQVGDRPRFHGVKGK